VDIILQIVEFSAQCGFKEGQFIQCIDILLPDDMALEFLIPIAFLPFISFP
jgi:hypothetical protein